MAIYDVVWLSCRRTKAAVSPESSGKVGLLVPFFAKNSELSWAGPEKGEDENKNEAGLPDQNGWIQSYGKFSKSIFKTGLKCELQTAQNL